MKNVKALSVALALCLAGTAALFSACGGRNETKEGVLTIHYYEGGYGSEWLEDALEEYQEDHPGFEYKLNPDPYISSTVTTYLQSGKNLSDIYMIQDGSKWAEWVSNGYIASLQDVYEAEVETSEGTIKVKDYMDQNLVGRYYMQGRVGQGDYIPWVLPEASISTSLIYNEDYLLATPHTTTEAGKWNAGDYWTQPPATVADLLAFCNDFNARGLKNSDGQAITPFTLAGKESHWLKFFLYIWFAQYQGVYEENELNADKIAGEGSYYDFWNFASENVWKMTGIQVAIDTLKQIFVDDSGEWKNLYGSVSEYSTQDAEREFVKGNSAMLIGGSFFYNEMRRFLDLNGDGKDDYTFKMMPLPTIENAQQNADGTPAVLSFYSTDEIIFVPAKATNLELAKSFLATLFSEENNLNFTQKTGTMRPFNYDPIALSGEGYQWSPFTKSVLDLYQNSDERLYSYPYGQERENVSLIYRYAQPDIFGSLGWATFLNSGIKKLTPAQVMVEGTSSFTSVFDATKEDYETWQERYYGD